MRDQTNWAAWQEGLITWSAEHELRQDNVAARKGAKAAYYEKMRLRRLEAEDDPEFILSPGRVRGYNVVTRQVVKNTLTFDSSLRMIVDHSPEGLESTSGNAATMLIKLNAGHILAKAMSIGATIVKKAC